MEQQIVRLLEWVDNANLKTKILMALPLALLWIVLFPYGFIKLTLWESER